MRGLGSAAALDERRADFVRLVRAAQGLVPLANAAAEAAAYDAHLVRYRAIDATGQASIAESLLQAQFARAYLAPGRPHAKLWTAAAEAAGQDPTRFEIGSRLLDDVVRQALFAELRRAGSWGAVVPAWASVPSTWPGRATASALPATSTSSPVACRPVAAAR
jgi:hypothetical protein